MCCNFFLLINPRERGGQYRQIAESYYGLVIENLVR
jgi:hypothetical protein